MKRRHYLLLRAWGDVAIMVFIAALPLFVKVDRTGFYFVIGFAACLAVRAYFGFRNARRARDEERAFAPPVDASAIQQIGYYRRILILGAIAFAVLAVVTTTDLNALQSGQKQSVMLVEPIGDLYQAEGYWPAVLAFPLLGLMVCGALLWKMRQLKEEAGRGA